MKFLEGNWNGQNYKVGIHTGVGAALAFRGASNLKNISLAGLDFSPTNFPDPNSNGYKKTITDTSYMFQNCPKLTSIQFPNMSTNVSNANYMFMSCTSLNNNGLINIEKFFSSSLITTQGMFYNCKSLTTVPDIVTSNVTNMLDMFSDCSSLNNFDSTKMKNFSTSSATNMQGMFRNSPNVQIFDASNLRVMAATNMNSMFSCSKTASLLIVAPDNSGSSLYNYNDQAIQGNRTPYPFPELNADGGTFEGNVSQRNYFNRCTYYQKDMQMSNINSFLNNNIPTKTGTIFVRWEPSINVNSLLDAARNKLVYKAIWKINPNISPDNQKVNSKGVLGFSYVPTEFYIANAVLNNNEQQSFPFQKIDSLDVGVRDQTNTNTSWRVCAQLKWGSANIPSGAYIQIGKQAKVTQNTNNGSTYNPSTNLVAVSNPVGIPNAIITTSSTIIMSNNGTTTLNGVYDLDLGNISLVLPEPQKVSVGSYTATVTWSLVTAP
ncbi:BspA family leucine-rich repeat surface protein [Enterococcus sp. DIV0691]|uniref:BspA family leucine-rich repeat surface protein n=1 Tax=Enterococcus sp. DIV0691 TaxID=2774703 RepID=UPI003F233387